MNIVREPRWHKSNRGSIAFADGYTLRVWKKGSFARWRVEAKHVRWRGQAASCVDAQEAATIAMASAVAMAAAENIRAVVVNTEKRSDMRAINDREARRAQ